MVCPEHITRSAVPDDGHRPYGPLALAAGGVLGGLMGAAPIGRLTGAGRGAHVVVPAALAAFGGGFATRERPVRTRLGVSAGLAGAVAGGQVVAQGLDRSIERFLVRRGVRHPRLVLGVASGAYAVVQTMRQGEPARPAVSHTYAPPSSRVAGMGSTPVGV